MTFSEQNGRSGFTLLELLAVITISVILLTLVGGSMVGSLKATQVAASMNEFSNNVASAVLMATRDNSPVMVRVYQFEDPDASVSSTQFRAFQLLRRSRNGSPKLEEITQMMRLAPGVVFHPDPEFSTLFARPLQSPNTVTDPQVPLPAGYRFVQFEVRADGSTDLPLGEPWSLTVVKDTPAPAVGSALPVDYRTVTINPVTCAIREY